MRVLLSLSLALAVSTGATGAQTLTVARAIAAIAQQPSLRNAIVSAEIYDLDAKRPLFARNAVTLMEAASTTKLLTEGTTLALLGADRRFTTPVYRTGALDGTGTIHGDLVLVASGDPNLSQREQPDGTLAFENEDHSYDGSYDTTAVPGDPLAVLRDLAVQAAKAGVKRIDGHVFVDNSLFPDAGPENGTGATVSSIVVNDNLVDVMLTPGTNVGDPVTIAVSPQTPYVHFTVNAKTAAAGTEPTIDMNADVANPDGTRTVTIAGLQPSGKPMLYAYRVPDPKRFAEEAFTVALSDAGIAVGALPAAKTFDKTAASASYVAANLVASHTSLPLSQDVRVTLKVSDNLHAALMPYLWAVEVAHANADHLKAGFALEHQLLTSAGLDLRGAAQQDGLGSFAYFTPDFMVRYLAWANAQPWFDVFHQALPILGVDGTLFNIQNDSPAKGRVFAKTGTWGSQNLLDDNGLVTKGLAGYMTTSHGRHIAFAFYLNRMAGKSSVDLSKDAAHAAGQILGSMATAAYETL